LDELFRRDGLELVGNWHVQPSGDDQPSTADDGCIREILEYREKWECRTQRALMLIFNPPRYHADNWKATSWVFHWGTYVTGDPRPEPEPSLLVGEALSSEGV
jgi:hypothetical protein